MAQERKPSDICASCGRRYDDHKVRHPFVDKLKTQMAAQKSDVKAAVAVDDLDENGNDGLNAYELDLCWRALGHWLSDYPHDEKATDRLTKLRAKLLRLSGGAE